MSGYIIEEPNEYPIRYSNGNEIIEYWRFYSPIQKKKFGKVLRQLKDTWYDVYNVLNTMRNYGLGLNECNDLMSKVHKLFIMEHRNKTDYYNDEKIRLRKQKGYLSKKINKLKSSKTKL